MISAGWGRGRSSVSGLTATVFGCTGKLGRYVVNRLGRSGTRVVVPHRGGFEEQYRHLRVAGDIGQIVPMEFSIRDEDSIRRTLEHSNVVINLIGAPRNSMNFTLDDVNVDFVDKLTRIAKEEFGISRFHHVSSLLADADCSESDFLRTKGLGEDIVRSRLPESVIFRPATLYSHEDHFLNLYAGMARAFGTVFVSANSYKSVVQPTYIADVAAAIVKSVNEHSFSGHTLSLAAPNKMNNRQMLREIFKHFNKEERPRIVDVPEQLLKMYGKMWERLPLTNSLTVDQVYRQGIVQTLERDLEILAHKGVENVSTFEDIGIEPVEFTGSAPSLVKHFRFLDADTPMTDLPDEDHSYFQKL